MSKFNLSDLIDGYEDDVPDPSTLEVWDNPPHSKIVRRFQRNGVSYVDVEFDNSPGKTYTYIKED